jgi:uncharacterized membrane protein YqiK
MESDIMYWVIGAGGGVALAVFETLLLRTLFRAALPHRLLVVSGRQYGQAGKVRGFSVHGGLRLVVPVVERVEELDATCVPCTVEVRNAYLKGAGPLGARWFALVRISREPGVVHDAVERFLGRSSTEVGRVATELLEGVARGLLATTTREEVEELAFVQTFIAEGSPALRDQGIELVHLSLDAVGEGV